MFNSHVKSVSFWRRLRSSIRRLPLLGVLAGQLGDVERYVVRTYQFLRLPKIRIYEEFDALAPNSAGNPRQRMELTKNTIHRLFPEINRLNDQLLNYDRPEILSIEAYLEGLNYEIHNSLELKGLFDSFGSDKADPNNYYKLYAYLLSTIENPKNILEILWHWIISNFG